MKHLDPILVGGWQEIGYRSGTENVSGIVGLGSASKVTKEKLSMLLYHYGFLQELFIRALNREGTEYKVYPINTEVVPNILSLSFDGPGGEHITL